MFDAADLIDDEQLIYALLERDIAAISTELGVTITVASDLDVDSIEEVPYVTFSLSGDGQTENGPGLWSAVLSISIYGVDEATPGDPVAAWDVARALYRRVHDWSMPGVAVVPNVGSVESVEDGSKFSRLVSGVQMIGKSVTQYVGSFGLTLRNQ